MCLVGGGFLIVEDRDHDVCLGDVSSPPTSAAAMVVSSPIKLVAFMSVVFFVG